MEFTVQDIRKQMKECNSELDRLEQACRDVPKGPTGDATRERNKEALKKYADDVMWALSSFWYMDGFDKEEFTEYCNLYIRARDDVGAERDKYDTQKAMTQWEKAIDKAMAICIKAQEKPSNDMNKRRATKEKVDKILDDAPNWCRMFDYIQQNEIDRFYSIWKKQNAVVFEKDFIIRDKY